MARRPNDPLDYADADVPQPPQEYDEWGVFGKVLFVALVLAVVLFITVLLVTWFPVRHSH